MEKKVPQPGEPQKILPTESSPNHNTIHPHRPSPQGTRLRGCLVAAVICLIWVPVQTQTCLWHGNKCSSRHFHKQVRGNERIRVCEIYVALCLGQPVSMDSIIFTNKSPGIRRRLFAKCSTFREIAQHTTAFQSSGGNPSRCACSLRNVVVKDDEKNRNTVASSKTAKDCHKSLYT